jgi:hypothetical protein
LSKIVRLLRRPTLGGVELPCGCPKFDVKRPALNVRYKMYGVAADAQLKAVSIENTGGADRDRTGDPLVANQVLSQLSYSPMLVTSC